MLELGDGLLLAGSVRGAAMKRSAGWAVEAIDRRRTLWLGFGDLGRKCSRASLLDM